MLELMSIERTYFMTFEEKYNNIKNIVKDDFIFLEQEIRNLFSDKNPLNEQLLTFLTAPSKRLRPLVASLFLRSIFTKILKSQLEVFTAVELIHNATLIHDDVIDNSNKRRKIETINSKFNNDLAVVAGDFLLSLALEKILKTKSVDVLGIFTNALKYTCMGEINQYFSKFQITSLEEYIEKSKNKTALLFQTGILGGLALSEKKDDKKLWQSATDFAQNFGIAFQIRDDLINIINADELKPNLNDVKSGVYTAPVIFAYQENPQILESNDFINDLKSTDGIEKTKALMDNYFDKSIFALRNIEDNKYKKAIIELTEILRESI